MTETPIATTDGVSPRRDRMWGWTAGVAAAAVGVGSAAVAIDFPMIFSGYADVHEWFDDESDEFRISVRVTNPIWGPLFGYEGRFRVEWVPCRSGDVPADMRPRREERRE